VRPVRPLSDERQHEDSGPPLPCRREAPLVAGPAAGSRVCDSADAIVDPSDLDRAEMSPP